MSIKYGVRYLKADEFVTYCANLNVATDPRELEYYEKTGVMLPVARLVYPDEYVIRGVAWSFDAANKPLRAYEWPELQRLSDKLRLLPEDYARLTDEELIDSFDREMGQNTFIMRPTTETYRPWSSYTVLVPTGGGKELRQSTVDHYYAYWQVHQLYHIQQYPDLYMNRPLLDQISEQTRQRMLLPRAPDAEELCEFNGQARLFDALSFWITVHSRERQRTFALVPEINGVRRLEEPQLRAYETRILADAKLVRDRFGLTSDNLYAFLNQLISLHDNYRQRERYKLSDELRNDILSLTQLIGIMTGAEWDRIADELGTRYTMWTKQSLRRLDVATRERGEARDVLIHFAGKYSIELTRLAILPRTRVFTESQVDELLDYCEGEDLSVLITALSGMVAAEDDYDTKFRRVTRYTNLKNVLTSIEYLLKDLAVKGGITLSGNTLNPVVRSVMANETGWIGTFNAKVQLGLTSAATSTGFLGNLTQLRSDPDLLVSEDAYWARVFLICCLARNLTVHKYANEDWFYGELFGEMLVAAIFALLYSWQIAKREGWV